MTIGCGAIDGILRRQGGVISREQAVAAGLSPAVVDQWLRRRRWCPLYPQVYLAAGHPGGQEARIRAAVLWAGDGAVLSGVAAAWWFGLVEQAPHRITLTVGRPARRRARAGAVVRHRRLAAEDVTQVRGLRLTALPLTVLEAAVELGAAGEPLLDRALQGWTPFPAVYDACRRNPAAHGSVAAERMLIAAADRSAAAARGLLTRSLRESGAAGWCSGITVAGYAVDVAFPAARVAIDVIGWARRQDAEHDRVGSHRRSVLEQRGWTVLQVGWADLVCRPWEPLADIATAVVTGMAHEPISR